MSRRNWIAPIVGPIIGLALFMFIVTSEGAQRAQRFSIVYIVVGGIFFVIALVNLRRAAKEVGARGKLSSLTVLGIALLLFAITCLMFAGVHCRIHELQKALAHPLTTANMR